MTVTDNDGFEDFTEIPVNVYISGDCNGDGEVDIFDATIIGLAWGHIYPDVWNTHPHVTALSDKADCNNDGEVDIFDAVIVGANWGHTAWDSKNSNKNMRDKLISIETSHLAVGDTFSIYLKADNPETKEIYAYQYEISVNSNSVKPILQETTDFLSQDGAGTSMMDNTTTNDMIACALSRQSVQNGISGSGNISKVTFEMQQVCASVDLNLSFMFADIYAEEMPLPADMVVSIIETVESEQPLKDEGEIISPGGPFSWNYEMGYRFTSNVNGDIIQLGFWGTGDGNTKTSQRL